MTKHRPQATIDRAFTWICFMQKSLVREALLFSPVRLGLEYVIIFGALRLYGTADAVVNSFAVLAALYLFRIVSGAINGVVTVVMHFITKRRRIQRVVSCLYAVRFPLLEEVKFVEDAANVFRLVSAANDVDNDARNYSAITLGELSALRSLGKFIALMQAHLVLDAALARYRSERDAVSAWPRHP